MWSCYLTVSTVTSILYAAEKSLTVKPASFHILLSGNKQGEDPEVSFDTDDAVLISYAKEPRQEDKPK